MLNTRPPLKPCLKFYCSAPSGGAFFGAGSRLQTPVIRYVLALTFGIPISRNLMVSILAMGSGEGLGRDVRRANSLEQSVKME